MKKTKFDSPITLSELHERQQEWFRYMRERDKKDREHAKAVLKKDWQSIKRFARKMMFWKRRSK